jgi:hypothetical protein
MTTLSTVRFESKNPERGYVVIRAKGHSATTVYDICPGYRVAYGTSWLSGECQILADWHRLLRHASACLKRSGDGRNPDFTIEPQNKVAEPIRANRVLCSVLIGVHFHKSNLQELKL